MHIFQYLFKTSKKNEGKKGRRFLSLIRIRWFGHSCFEINNGETCLVTDPHDGHSIGIPTPSVKADIILVSHDHYDHNSVKTVEKKESRVVTDEGEREILDVKIHGIGSFHDPEKGEKRGRNTIYSFVIDDVSFCHLGDLGHELDDEIIQKIGKVDILFIPIGGTFTIDGKQAWNVIKAVKPRIVIPMHYKIGGLSLPIDDIDVFLKQADYRVRHVGNEIDIEKEDIPDEPEIWTFTL